MLLNQSEARTIEPVSSLSAYKSKLSLTACLLTFCNQLGALKSELVSSLSINKTKERSQVTK